MQLDEEAVFKSIRPYPDAIKPYPECVEFYLEITNSECKNNVYLGRFFLRIKIC